MKRVIILDMGSGNTCRNYVAYAKNMIDVVASMDSGRHLVLLKWQLEHDAAPPNTPLSPEVLAECFTHAKAKGYYVGSSVFTVQDLSAIYPLAPNFLKIACPSQANPMARTWDLLNIIPRGAQTYVSYDARKPERPPYASDAHVITLACVPEYPAKLEDYPPISTAFSDHTPGLQLWNYYHPCVWEKHFVLERDPANPDAGEFALTPDQLREVIG